MVWKILGVAALAATLLTGSLEAATLVNRQAESVNITVIEGGKKIPLTLAPSEEQNICPSGCLIRLENNRSDEFEIDSRDRLSIEGGNIYVDTGND